MTMNTSPDPKHVHETVAAHLRRLLGRAAPVDAGMRLRDDLQVSSILLVALVTDLCETLGVDMLAFSELDLVRLHRVGDVNDLFERHTASGAAQPAHP